MSAHARRIRQAGSLRDKNTIIRRVVLVARLVLKLSSKTPMRCLPELGPGAQAVFLASILPFSVKPASGLGLLAAFQYPWPGVRNLFCEYNAASPLFGIPGRWSSNPWCTRGFLEVREAQSAY